MQGGVLAPAQETPIELNLGRGSANRRIGIACGVMLLLTAVIPWGLEGESPLWSWHIFDRFFAFLFKVMAISAWAAGLAALVSGAFLRGMARTAVYALTGVLAFAIYLLATKAGSLVSLLYVPSVIPCVCVQAAAVGALPILLLATGARLRGVADTPVCVLQCIASLLILGIAGYGAVESARCFGAGLPNLLSLTAACMSAVGCLLVVRHSFAKMEIKGIILGRRLVLASLVLMIVREITLPLFLGRQAATLLGRLNDQIILAGTALIALEGLIGLGVRFPKSILFASAVFAMGVTAGFCDWGSHVYAATRGANHPAEEPSVHRTGEWSQWCGALDRNMVRDEKGLPDTFDSIAGKKTSDLNNVKWVASLSTRVLGSPVISGGKVFIGGEIEGKNEIAVMWCFQESDGKLLWRMLSPYIPHLYNVHTYGACATPTVEGDRLYMLGHLGDALCLSANGMAGGNQGSFVDEAAYFASGRTREGFEISPDGHRSVVCSAGTPATLSPMDADILWRFDLIRETDCWPLNALNAAVIIRGERLYVATCSTFSDPWWGDESSQKWIQAWKVKYHKTAYDSPSLIVLDKATGKLLARDRGEIFEKTFHGAHSSPALGTVNGNELLFYGGGNGVCYAYDPEFTPGVAGKPGELNLVWKFDCLTPSIEKAEVIATPVFYKNRIYISIGNDLARSGPSAGPGRLVCIDATQTGNITRTGKIWSFEDMRSSGTTVAIADGLLYTADAAGNIYCLDSESGRLYWRHKATTPIWSSPLIADGKVYLGTHGSGLLVFEHSKEKKLLSQNMPGADIVASPAIANGVLYIASQKHLYAIESGKTGGLVEPETKK